MVAEMNLLRTIYGTIFLPKMLADVFNCQKYDPSENVRSYDFPIANLLGHVSGTKIRVHSFIDFENLRRTTLHRTDIYRNVSLGAPEILLLEVFDHIKNVTSRSASQYIFLKKRKQTDISKSSSCLSLENTCKVSTTCG